MNKLAYFFIAFFSCILATSNAKTIKINVFNSNPADVANAPVVIRLDKYAALPAAQRTQLAVFIDGKQTSSQLDDLDKDGTPDELVFLVNLRASESRQVTLKTIADKKREKFPQEVYADLIVKEKDGSHRFVSEASSDKNDMYNKLHHHGIAFETALIAYRIYFDNKSTIDIYGKRKHRLEIAETGWYPTEKQLAEGYGDDILLVNSWVGVGTVKGWDGTKASHIDKFDKRTQRIVATGNIRTVSEIEVNGWQYEGKKIDLTVRYIMYARHRDVLCEVRASDDINALTTGVQQIGGGELLSNNNLVGSWGSFYPQPDSVKYAKETAGLGVYLPEKYNGKHIRSGVDNLLLMPYTKGEALQFYLTAASMKEEKDTFTSAQQFFAYLENWSKTLKPVEVK